MQSGAQGDPRCFVVAVVVAVVDVVVVVVPDDYVLSFFGPLHRSIDISTLNMCCCCDLSPPPPSPPTCTRAHAHVYPDVLCLNV